MTQKMKTVEIDEYLYDIDGTYSWCPQEYHNSTHSKSKKLRELQSLMKSEMSEFKIRCRHNKFKVPKNREKYYSQRKNMIKMSENDDTEWLVQEEYDIAILENNYDNSTITLRKSKNDEYETFKYVEHQQDDTISSSDESKS